MSIKIGFHASHEQFSPRELLELAKRAEGAGFDALFCSDHISPWGERQGHSGFSFAWIAAALAQTSLPARMICCPYGRYHPTTVAQAAVTLEDMFPRRFGIALGSGQNLNEHVVGRPWPKKTTRQELLKRSYEIVVALLEGKTVHDPSGILPVDEAKIFGVPPTSPPVFVAAVTEDTARFAGEFAAGLLTTSRPYSEAVSTASSFRGKTNRPLWMKVGLSFAATEEKALSQAHLEWGNAAFPNHVLTEVKTTSDFDEMGRSTRPEELRKYLRVSSDLEQHIAWLADDIRAGYEEIFVHNVGPNQREFVDVFGAKVLPALRKISA